jgi:hypothetical protein
MKRLICLAFVLMFLSLPSTLRAEDVNLSVKVVPRLPTDTINDFNFSFNNSQQVGQVKGATVSNNAFNLPSMPKLGIISLAYSFLVIF